MADWSRSGDGELLAAARRDGEAFGVFYDRHVAVVLAFFRRRTNGAELAMDLTAETFARALEACCAGRAIGQPSPASWLFTIARHLLIDAYRRGRVDDRARRRLALDPIVLTDEGLDRVETTAATGAEQLGRVVAELPPTQREAIEAHVIQERSYAEIAATLRCSESVVRQRVSRGLATLRSRLAREEW